MNDLVVMTRDEAHVKALLRFYTGKPCRHGHWAERYTSTGGCVMCVTRSVPKLQNWNIVNVAVVLEFGKRPDPAYMKELQGYLELCAKSWVQQQRERAALVEITQLERELFLPETAADEAGYALKQARLIDLYALVKKG